MRSGRFPSAASLLLLCAAVALTAYLAAAPRSGGGRDSPASSEGAPAPAVEQVLSAPASPSSSGEFLDDLERRTGVVGNGETQACVSWSDERGLVAAARGALSAYREEGTSSLVTSGYLDLSGRVWGALVRHETGAVDIMVAFEAKDGTATVRVTRLLPVDQGR